MSETLKSERSLIGSILLEPARVLDLCIAENLSQDGFLDTECQLVYRAARWLRENGHPVDVTSVTDTLRRYGKLDEVGGSAGIDKFIDETPTSAHAEYYLEQVCNAWTLRVMEEENKSVIERAKMPDVNVSDLMAGHIQKMIDISSKKRDKSQDKKAIWEKARKQAHAARAGTPIGLPFPFPNFSHQTGGARFGVVTAIVGRKGTRKSYIINQCGVYAAIQQAHPVPGAYYPLEDGQEIAMTRASCILAGVSCWHYEHGLFTDEEAVKVDGGAQQLIDSGYAIREGRGLSRAQMRLDIARGVAKFGWRFVIVDAFKDMDNSGGDYKEEGKLSKWGQDVAREFDLAFIFVHHVRKNRGDAQTKEDKKEQRLTLEDIRGNSRLGDDAKQVVILQCKRQRSEEGNIVYGDYMFDCVANNFGRAAVSCLDIDHDTGTFTERADRKPWTDEDATQGREQYWQK